MAHRFNLKPYLVAPGEKVHLSKFDTDAPPELRDKKKLKELVEEDVEVLRHTQELLWANQQHGVLIILQGLDASGKDSAIKHIMSGVNPQGCEVHSFRAPSEEELSHHFLWRPVRFLPSRGRINIFNRSYYEEVLVVRVHTNFLEAQGIDPNAADDAFWSARFDKINDFEKLVCRNGTVILKFYLHQSKGEQKKRFLARLDNPEKHWKFSLRDVKERQHWDDYMHAYEALLAATSTKNAPWHVIPADNKWFARALIADTIASKIVDLHDGFPKISADDRAELDEGRKLLEKER